MGAEADFLAEMRSVYVAQRAAGRRKFNTLVLTHDKTLQFFPALAQAVSDILNADKDLDYDALTAWYDAPLKQAGELMVAILALEAKYLAHADMQRFIATAKAELNAQTAGAFYPQLTALHARLKEKLDFSKLQSELKQKEREITEMEEQKVRELGQLERAKEAAENSLRRKDLVIHEREELLEVIFSIAGFFIGFAFWWWKVSDHNLVSWIFTCGFFSVIGWGLASKINSNILPT